MKNLMKTRNVLTAGFSLIEVLVAVAIVGILSMGIASMVNNMNRSNSFISAKQDYLALNNLLLQMIPTSKCKYILQGAAANQGTQITDWQGTPSMTFTTWGGTTNINHILENAQNVSATAIVTAGQPYGSRMSINSIQLINAAADTPVAVTVSGSTDTASLPNGAYRRGFITLRVVPTLNGQIGSIQPMDHKFDALVYTGDNKMYLCGDVQGGLTAAGATTAATTCSGGSAVGATRTAYSTNSSTNCAGVSTTQTCDATGAWLPAGYPYTSCTAPTTASTTFSTTACSKTCTSSTTSKTSDIRVKQDVKDFSLGLNQILNIRPVTYKYNGLGETPVDTQDRVGVIAQDVLKVAPSLVGTQNVKMHPEDQQDTQIHNVNYEAFTFMLINSVKELNKNQKVMQQSIEELKKQNRDLKSAICAQNPQSNECH